MSTTVFPAAATLSADSETLRVVLFGMPDAGKSSLLGALVQSTQTQDRLLQGRLLDLTNGLAELWRRVYEDRQRETLEEIVPYPIVFEPYPGDPDATPKLNVMLYDCDGRVANELLSQRKSLQRDAKTGSLAKAVLDADALILTVDGSAGMEQVETDFREFVRFLRVLETHRSHDRAVGGLPVFLALSKCDRLAREPIPKKEWEARIEERKGQVKERFSRYLEGNAGAAGALLTFGSIDLQVIPTAVKRPALTDAPAHPREPLGVAELFHDCLHSAYAFRQRSISADRRLKWTLAGAGGFLALAAAMGIAFFTTGGPIEKPVGLIEKVEQFQAREKPVPERLANDQLQRRKTELDGLRDNAEFERLPDDKKAFIRGRIDELQAYLRYREQLGQVSGPEKDRTLDDLAKTEERIKTQASIPASFQNEWEKTPAVIERDRRLQECQTIRDGVDELRTFFRDLQNKAKNLLFAKEFDPGWEKLATAVLTADKNPPFPRAEGVKGLAYQFNEVELDEKEWAKLRLRLDQVRDLALALGLTRDQPREEAVFVLPAETAEGNLNSFSASRLKELKERYPTWKNWSLASVPDALQAELRKKLKRSQAQLIRNGQRSLLIKYQMAKPNGEDAPKDWSDIAAWMLSPALQEWRELMDFIAKLIDPAAENPVNTAAAFLQKPSFDMQFRALTLSIPENLPQGELIPGDLLRVHLMPQGVDPVRSTLSFRLDKSATVEGPRERRFRYVLDEGDGRLTFKPGDEFGAELRLTKGGKIWQFTWSGSRTASYGFESLDREPIVHAAGPSDRGTAADGVTLAVDGRFPAVPTLIPDVRRNRK